MLTSRLYKVWLSNDCSRECIIEASPGIISNPRQDHLPDEWVYIYIILKQNKHYKVSSATGRNVIAKPKSWILYRTVSLGIQVNFANKCQLI